MNDRVSLEKVAEYAEAAIAQLKIDVVVINPRRGGEARLGEYDFYWVINDRRAADQVVRAKIQRWLLAANMLADQAVMTAVCLAYAWDRFEQAAVCDLLPVKQRGRPRLKAVQGGKA